MNNVIVSTAHGPMLVNRQEAGFYFGVGKDLLERGIYEPQETALFREIVRRLPPGGAILDIGANIGVHTLELSRAEGSTVHAFEPQRQVFYLLAGNVALNNRANVHCHLAAVGNVAGRLKLPRVNYDRPASFGSLELGAGRQQEQIGQEPDWSTTEDVPMVTIDGLALERLDFAKIDVEGMELRVLEGGRKTIYRDKPALCIEHLKSRKEDLQKWLVGAGYDLYALNALNWIAIHRERRLFEVEGLARAEEMKL